MTNDNKVYVILCTYNSEKTLLESIESILDQTYEDLELVIVDDGSTDNTDSILRDIKNKDSRVHIIKKKNSGLGDSRNIAIEYSTNKGANFVAFCDADDVWMSEKLELQMQVFKLRPNADVVVTGMIAYHKTLPRVETNRLSYAHLENIFETLCLNNFPFQPVTAVIRSHVFDDDVKFTNDVSGQDFYPYLMLAFKEHEFYKVEQPLYRERQLIGSLQRSPNSAYLGSQARVKAVLKLMHKMGTSDKMNKEKMILLQKAHDKYCSWMLSGARGYISYFQQLTLSLKNLNKFHNKLIAVLEITKSTIYPLVHLYRRSIRR